MGNFNLYSPKGRIFFYSVMNKMRDDLEKSKKTEEYKIKWRGLIQKKIEEYEEKFKIRNQYDSGTKKNLDEKIKKHEMSGKIIINREHCKDDKEVSLLIIEISKRTIASNYRLNKMKQKVKGKYFFVSEN